MDEIGEIADYVHSEVGSSPNIIWGTGIDENLGESISITIIATGFGSNSIPELYAKKTAKRTVTLTDSEAKERRKEPKIEFPEEKARLEDITLNFTQRTIDFDIKQSRDADSFIVLHEPEDEAEVVVETKKSEIQKKLNESRERMKEKRFDSSKINENIDEFENEPAYKRKNLKIDQPTHVRDNEISRYTLSDDEEGGGARLRPNNSYLHDNVD